MNRQRLLGTCTLLGSALWIGSMVRTVAAETSRLPPSVQSGDASTGNDMKSQIERLVRYAMPSTQHRLLDRLTGRWNTLTQYWMAPGVEPVESKGASERRWILEGRFVLEQFDGGNLALPFRGLGLYGYDGFEQKYTSAWVDTLNTAIMSNLGIYDKTNDVVNFVGQYGDSLAGLKREIRGRMRFLNEDKHQLELQVVDSDGRKFKMLEITYTRAMTEPKNETVGPGP